MKYLITLLSCISISLATDGKIGGVTYFDFISANDSTAFNFQRQYFMYGINVFDNISFKVVFDVGRTKIGTVLDKEDAEKSEDTRLLVFLKKAQVDYKTLYGKVSMGLIGMNTYGIQEKNWGYRFIEKSAIDLYKFSTTTDLGMGFSRSLIENLNISLQVVNGEGYKKSQSDKYHKISFNATYGERNLYKHDGYNTGFVYSSEIKDSDPTNMISIFGGFSGMGLRLGAEYDLLANSDEESNIISASVNYGAMEKLEAFIRYDMYDEDTGSDGDGKNYIIAGASFKCGKGLSIAPNVRIYTFENKSDSKTSFVINFQFKF